LPDPPVDVSFPDEVTQTATGVALIVVGAGGDNQIAVASGANHALDDNAVRAGLEGRLAGQGCLVASFELGDGAVLQGARAARAADWSLLVNPAPARPIPPELLALAPILTPNETEARQLTGAADVESAARALTQATGAPVVITMGARGVLLADGDRLRTIAAPSVGVVDTTGAGDAFNGALAAQLAAGVPIEHGAQVAVVAASLSVTAPGARSGLPGGAALNNVLSAPPAPSA
jgi:ribokinase